MNYEVQQALDRKVDEWKFNALQGDIAHLKSENNELKHKIDHAEGNLRNHYLAIEKLINLLLERGLFEENINELYEIKSYL